LFLGLGKLVGAPLVNDGWKKRKKVQEEKNKYFA
jgi:hypothetical protein